MQHPEKRLPGLVIAGLRGGSGKTVISLGITAAWKALGIRVSPFKKGPDYIDAGWLSKAAGRACYNLDTFLCSRQQVIHSFRRNSLHSDIAVVEGNRGLFDGIDTDGTTSTAEIAKLLNLPVLLVLDCTKSTRTMAALLMGCLMFDPALPIIGVVLNQVAGKRHEGKVRDNIARYCRIPVFGAVPKLSAQDFPERHMGLVPTDEHDLADTSLKAAAGVAENNIDLDALYKACIEFSKTGGQDKPPGSDNMLPAMDCPVEETPVEDSIYVNPSCITKRLKSTGSNADPPVIGIIRDSAFQFYYPDNFEALEELGARLTFLSPLTQDHLPPVHAIYMGGGFPETHAPQLAENEAFRGHLRRLADQGLPIYAECGGLIFLGKDILLDGVHYPMSGILPLSFGLSQRPVGHGYTTVVVNRKNPFFSVGQTFNGHEFRYSSVRDIDYSTDVMAFTMSRGRGIVNKLDGFFRDNVFGTYTHILASGTSAWAEAIVSKALWYKNRQASAQLNCR